MPDTNHTDPDVWSTVTRSGSPQPVSSHDDQSQKRSGKNTHKKTKKDDKEKKEQQDQDLMYVGSHFGA